MLKNDEYLKIIKDLKDSVDILLQGFFDLKKELKDLSPKRVDLSRQFSLINLPSEGLYYKDKNKSLLINYLGALEENILCDSMLMESGKGMEFVLSNLIIDDFDAKTLLLSDFQAILIFLRSTAFGNSVEIKTKCPHCGIENDTEFRLSELNFKEPKVKPNENGEYVIFFPEIETTFILSPLTLEKEYAKSNSEDEDDYFVIKDEFGVDTKIRKEKTLSLIYNINSINGVTDKKKNKKTYKKNT